MLQLLSSMLLFKCNLHCQLIVNEIQNEFFVEKLEPFPFLTIFKGSFKFCEYCKIWCHEEKVSRALLSKSLMDFLSKWEIYRALPHPVFFRFFIQKQIQIVQYVQIWICNLKDKMSQSVIHAFKPSFLYFKYSIECIDKICKDGLDGSRKSDKVPYFSL